MGEGGISVPSLPPLFGLASGLRQARVSAETGVVVLASNSSIWEAEGSRPLSLGLTRIK